MTTVALVARTVASSAAAATGVAQLLDLSPAGFICLATAVLLYPRITA
ncbi:hypothetical protein AB0I93_26890 [Streptomyces sp. NPDC049967]